MMIVNTGDHQVVIPQEVEAQGGEAIQAYVDKEAEARKPRKPRTKSDSNPSDQE